MGHVPYDGEMPDLLHEAGRSRARKPKRKESRHPPRRAKEEDEWGSDWEDEDD